MNTAETIAIVLGSLSGVLLMVFLYFYFRNRNKVSSRNPDMRQGTSRQGMNLMNEIDRLRQENSRLRGENRSQGNYGSYKDESFGEYGYNSVERPTDMTGAVPSFDDGYQDYDRYSPPPF